LERVSVHAEQIGKALAVALAVVIAEIDDERRFGAVEPSFELLRRHSRDPQAAQEALALDPLEDHVCRAATFRPAA